MEDKGLKPAQAEITMSAIQPVLVQDKEAAEKVIKLTDMLEDLDDVQEVCTNADIAEEIMAELE